MKSYFYIDFKIVLFISFSNIAKGFYCLIWNFSLNKLLKISGIILTLSIAIAMLLPFILIFVNFLQIPTHITFDILFSKLWFPANSNYGSFNFILNSILISLISVLFAFPFAISIALALKYYFENYSAVKLLRYSIEIISNFPAILIGIWAYYFVNPVLFMFFKIIKPNAEEFNLLSLSIILSFMLLPILSKMFLNIFNELPEYIEEQANAMGAVKFDIIRKVIIPHSTGPIFGAMMFSFIRIFGEGVITLIFLNFNFNQSDSLLKGSGTLSSTVANFLFFNNSISQDLLISLVIVLFFFALVFNIFGSFLISKSNEFQI